jgi:hypothetical protein
MSEIDVDHRKALAMLGAYMEGLDQVQEVAKVNLEKLNLKLHESAGQSPNPGDMAVFYVLKDLVSIIEKTITNARKAIDE